MKTIHWIFIGAFLGLLAGAGGALTRDASLKVIIGESLTGAVLGVAVLYFIGLWGHE